MEMDSQGQLGVGRGVYRLGALILDGRFGNGTSDAGSDVLPDILSKVRPIEILL